jgi:hypothetical protein
MLAQSLVRMKACLPKEFVRCCNLDGKKRLRGSCGDAVADDSSTDDDSATVEDDKNDDSSDCSTSTEGDNEWVNFMPLHEDAASLSSISDSDTDDDDCGESIQDDDDDDDDCFYDVELGTTTRLGSMDKCAHGDASRTTLTTDASCPK